MSFFKTWLLGVVAAAFAVSLAQALTPSGPVKKAGRLVGGLVLLLAVARPLLTLDVDSLAASAAVYGDVAVMAAETARPEEEVLKTLIAQQAGAYIAEKGQALGCTCSARVTVERDENGWDVPWETEVTGVWTAHQQEELSRAIAQELDIPPERQIFREEAP